MTTQRRSLTCLAFAALLFGCASTPPQTVQVVPLNDAACNVAGAVAHIQARHCNGGAGAGTQYANPAAQCTQASLQAMCTAVQNAPNANSARIVQGDGRIRYDVNLNMAVGAGGERCVRLLTTAANGDVVTMFPEDAGAPGACM